MREVEIGDGKGKFSFLEKTRKPMKFYTDSSLLKYMKNPFKNENKLEAGLGTPATRSNIIEELINRGYISREAKKISSTAKGDTLIESLPDDFDLAETSSFLEKSFSKIISNPDEYEKIKSEGVESLKKLFYLIPVPADEDHFKCTCGSSLLTGKFGLYCEKKTDDCVSLPRELLGTDISSHWEELLNGKETERLRLTSKKTGKAFDAHLQLEGKNIKFIFPKKKKKA